MIKKNKKRTVKKPKKRPIFRTRKPHKRPLEERLLEWDEDEEDLATPLVSEKMRAKLLKEEFKLRKKQPTAWTKTKYRKFAMFAFNRKKKEPEPTETTKEAKTNE